MRAIFSEVDSAKPAHQMAPFSVPSECRLARDPRLLAAHEQLTLTPTCNWVGDCMRRDPGKRDALERFAPNCAQTGAHAIRSFESLWRATVPVYAMPADDRRAGADARVNRRRRDAARRHAPPVTAR